MTLQDTLKTDLKTAMKAKDTARKEAIRVVMGEMARSDKKAFSDEEIVRILKKLIKSEKEMLEKSSQKNSSAFIDIIAAYLPQMATPEEIRGWIEANVDLSAYKNKMQAMGAIMVHFGSSADGNQVKQVLQKMPG